MGPGIPWRLDAGRLVRVTPLRLPGGEGFDEKSSV
jgi:hypothetical protein